jgi:hypothetical protein
MTDKPEDIAVLVNVKMPEQSPSGVRYVKLMIADYPVNDKRMGQARRRMARSYGFRV